MPSERSLAYWQRVKWIEAFVLLFAIPTLLFPERFIFLAALALLLLALLWLAPLFATHTPLIPPTPFNMALVIFAAALMPAMLVTVDPALTLPKATGTILGLAAWRFIVIAVRRRHQVSWAIGAYLLFGLAFIGVGLLNADWLLKSTSQVPFLGGMLARGLPPTGLLPIEAGIHPNQIAGTITLVLPLLIAMLAGRGPLHLARRWPVAAAVILCTAALLLTQSRSGWAGLLGGLFIMALMWTILMAPSRGRTALRLTLLAAVTILLLLLLFIGPQRVQQAWLEPPPVTAVGSLATFNFRQELWPWALRAIGDFPYTGTGLGTFRVVAGRLYPIGVDPAFDFAHAHNVFLQVALDVGLPGLIAYGAILLLCAVVSWLIARADPAFRPYALGLLASLVAFHIYGLADTLALGSKPFSLFWALTALLSAMIRLR